MTKHFIRFLDGMTFILQILAFLMFVMFCIVVFLVPIFLAFEISPWWLLLYTLYLIVGAYWIGGDNDY